jgi:helicase
MAEIIQSLLKMKNWENLNPIQNEAVKCGILDEKTNFLVFAPTGSGKTGIAEIAMLQELLNNGKIIYAVPSHSLIGDKLKDFDYLSPKFKVKEGSSSFSLWKNSDVIVTTFELLYRACLATKEFLNDFAIIIIDEFHILYDETRGYNLEKLLTILKEGKVRVFCISATFEDKQEAREWLNAKIIQIPDQLRSVPIEYYLMDLSIKGVSLVASIVSTKNEPVLIFCSTKHYTKDRAEEICKLLTKKNDGETITQKVKEVTGKDELPELETALCKCIEYGVGFHHSDLSVELREYVAQLFIDRKIDYLFSTTTLAYGVNFPARSVVVADLSLYDVEDKGSKPLPTHLFLQMAGRAGRIKFGNKGYCYVAIRKEGDKSQVDEYLSGHLTKAISHIGRDDYFYKAILELIFSKRDTQNEITDFFLKSFFNFQASKEKNLMVPFNLEKLLSDRMNDLNRAGFIEQMGINYKLTKFGQITLDYLFGGVSSPELISFIRLNKYVESIDKLEFNFEFIYFLSKSFSDCRISKQPREKVQEIERFFQNKGVADRTHAEYSAFAVYNKWINNVKELEIDSSCKVYSSNLPFKMREMTKLMEVSQKLAESRNCTISPDFEAGKERIYYGVREDELPLVKIRGIKRELARAIKAYCDGVLKTLHGYNGDCIQVLEAVLQKEGEAKFLGHLQTIPNISTIRSQKILDLIKNISSK